MRETVTVEYVAVVARTDRGVLLDLDGRGDERWFPLTDNDGDIWGLEDCERGDGPGEFDCPLWLAKREELD